MEESKKMSEDHLNDLLEKYYNNYIVDAGSYDDELIDMDEFNSYFSDYSPIKIANYVLNADRFNPDMENNIEVKGFNLNDCGFYIDGYGYPVSVPESYIVDFYKSRIDENNFIKWLEDNDYIDDID